MGIIFDHSIEHHEQLAHAGSDDDFEFFSLSGESFGEFFQGGIEAFGGEGGHVEGVADVGSPTPNGAFAPHSSAIVVEGGQAREGGDFLSVELSEFGEIGHEGGGRGLAHAGNAGEEFGFGVPIVVGFEQLEDSLFDGVDFLVQEVDDFSHAPRDQLSGIRFEAIGFGGSQGDELSSAGDELLQFGLFFGQLIDQPGLDLLSEAGDDGGVEAIGFCQDAESAGEVADLPGIDDGHVMAGLGEFGHELALVSAGGFDHDQAGLGRGELLHELGKSLGSVVALPRAFLGQDMHVEGGLGDIDSDKMREVGMHVTIPVLQMRARLLPGRARTALAAVRAKFTNPATILLCDGLGRPIRDRSVAGGQSNLRSTRSRGTYFNCLYLTSFCG